MAPLPPPGPHHPPAPKDGDSQCSSVSRERRRSWGRKEPLRGGLWAFQRAPKPFQSALGPSGGLGSSRGSSTAWTLPLPPTRAVSAQGDSQAGGRDRVLAVPLTQTTFLRTKIPEMGHPSPCLLQLGLDASPAPLSVQGQGCELIPRMGIWEHHLERSHPEGGFGVPRAVSLVSEDTRSPMALPAQAVVAADCLSSSWLHLEFDPQSWKSKKNQTQNLTISPPNKQKTKQSEEPDLRGRQEGRVGTAGSRGPDSLTLFAGHGARLCPPPCPARGCPEQPPPPPVAAKGFSGRGKEQKR